MAKFKLILFLGFLLLSNCNRYQSKNFAFIISGPSGVGKTTIANILLEKNPTLKRVISITTRPPRVNEKHGIDYFFISKDECNAKKNKQEFLEISEHLGNCYGTTKENFNNILKEGKNALFIIDPVGLINLKIALKNFKVVSVFLNGDTDIIEKRLKDRKSETEKSLNKRLERNKTDLKYAEIYDYTIDTTAKNIDQVYAAVNKIYLQNVKN